MCVYTIQYICVCSKEGQSKTPSHRQPFQGCQIKVFLRRYPQSQSRN